MLEKYQLRNGMKVLLIPTHKSPVVSVQAWVNTGSADERKGEEGISHFIEHLLFKGTRKYGVGEIASIVEGSGGELNAYTSFDQTVFYVTISNQFTNVALETISEMMGYPAFDGKEIDNEREVVIEEIKRSHDSPHRQSSRLLFSTVYKRHPYKDPILGFEENIRNVSVKKIRDYYFSRYVPQNMTLVVTGDFQNKEIKKNIEGFFEPFAKHKFRKVKRIQEPKQSQPRVNVTESPFSECFMNLAWQIEGFKHPDVPVIDVLSLILGQGESSRLFHRLRVQESLVNEIGSGAYTPKENGFLVISSQLKEDKLQLVLDAISDEIIDLVAFGPTKEEIDKAVTILESEEFYSLETVDGLSRKYGTYETLVGDPNYFKTYLEKINKVTSKDIVRVARKYLSPQRLSVTSMISKDKGSTQKKIDEWLKTYDLAFDFATKNRDLEEFRIKRKPIKLSPNAAAKTQEVKEVKLDGGGRLFYLPSFDTPTISLKAGFLGGVKSENQKLSGLSELMADAWMTGTKNKTEQEINALLDRTASGMGAFAGRNTVGLSLTTLTPFFDEVSDLYKEVLTSPRFSKAGVEREKQSIIEKLQNRKDNPAQLAIRRFTEEMFKGHSYELDPQGTEASLKGLTFENVRQQWEKCATQEGLVMAAVGAFDEGRLLEKAQQISSRLNKGKFDFPIETHEGPKKKKSIFESIDKAQSHILLGFKGIHMKDERKYALELINAVLSGQGGRLFLELRDKASLAYSVAPISLPGYDTGYFATYIGCSPEKGKKAIEMMRTELNKLVETPISDDEMERSKRYLIGKHDIELQRNSSVCSSILFSEIYGISYRETNLYPEKIRAVTKEDVRELAEEIFSQPELIVTYGSENPYL